MFIITFCFHFSRNFQLNTKCRFPRKQLKNDLFSSTFYNSLLLSFSLSPPLFLFISPRYFFLLWSISSTFCARVFCTKVLSYFGQSQNVTREKLNKALLYKQCVGKMLMKLTTNVVLSQTNVDFFYSEKN